MRSAVRFCLVALWAAGAFFGQSAQARIAETSEQGIVLRYVAAVPGSPEKAWTVLVAPALWWDGAHSYSGDSANLTIDPRAGGCFCERLPASAGDGAGKDDRGSVEHMRVIHADKARLLRMSGALGPLQAEAVQGAMTFTLAPLEDRGQGGTRIVVEYVLGGYSRAGLSRIAPAVDAVLGSQIERLARKLGGRIEPEAAR
ncbi:SRPBCC family protein [Novosphingobium sp.]|jgi:hypothetical protein|uniref:SRPBCC family protein n=1 Tax=Novosphingobium sp. TaxID=1874826 RepID=UPI002FE2657E